MINLRQFIEVWRFTESHTLLPGWKYVGREGLNFVFESPNGLKVLGEDDSLEVVRQPKHYVDLGSGSFFTVDGFQVGYKKDDLVIWLSGVVPHELDLVHHIHPKWSVI